MRQSIESSNLQLEFDTTNNKIDQLRPKLWLNLTINIKWRLWFAYVRLHNLRNVAVDWVKRQVPPYHPNSPLSWPNEQLSSLKSSTIPNHYPWGFSYPDKSGNFKLLHLREIALHSGIYIVRSVSQIFCANVVD